MLVDLKGHSRNSGFDIKDKFHSHESLLQISASSFV